MRSVVLSLVFIATILLCRNVISVAEPLKLNVFIDRVCGGQV